MIGKMISNETVFEYLSLPPATVMGYRGNGKPIYNIAGGSGEITTGDNTDDDDDDSTDDSTDDTDEDNWTPPTREDWHKLQDAKKKADSEAAARKRFLRDAGFDPKTGKPIEKPSVTLDDEDTADTSDTVVSTKSDTAPPTFDRDKFEKQFQRQLDREVQKAERTGRTSSYSLIHEVPAALDDAGWNGKNLARMIKLLDLDSVEIDADGIDADALDSQVAELKKDFPEFFKRQRMKDAAKEVADTETIGGGKKKAPVSTDDMDWKARMRAQLLQGG
jgi:hypothetical protein